MWCFITLASQPKYVFPSNGSSLWISERFGSILQYVIMAQQLSVPTVIIMSVFFCYKHVLTGNHQCTRGLCINLFFSTQLFICVTTDLTFSKVVHIRGTIRILKENKTIKLCQLSMLCAMDTEDQTKYWHVKPSCSAHIQMPQSGFWLL